MQWAVRSLLSNGNAVITAVLERFRVANPMMLRPVVFSRFQSTSSARMEEHGFESTLIADVLKAKGKGADGSWLRCTTDDSVYNAVKSISFYWTVTAKRILRSNFVSKVRISYLFNQNLHSITMISSRRLIKLARKQLKKACDEAPGESRLQKITVIMARTYQYQLLIKAILLCTPQMKQVISIVMLQQARFTIPLKYLGKSVFRELLRMSEEVLGIPNNGPITLLCDSTFLKYVLALVRGGISEGLEKSQKTFPETCHFSVSSLGQSLSSHQQTPICSH
ncbi:hypothetical protein LWI28_000222 [Acer negundo]|uniref:Uncharacterized protein n=1 Tax=Acer negundo TaxID=4023 RepID=A0AAD5J319_ACENE|nr:hypothetical protein LWI28_000222 [Acer negundo]